ncbi:tryptophan RNA-binding attenuator protein-like domain-containing protein [Irpex lacteus]|nr:tryptophan RNA-binding attenuator protein-like domain-containing protein [Irpex lacteus]
MSGYQGYQPPSGYGGPPPPHGGGGYPGAAAHQQHHSPAPQGFPQASYGGGHEQYGAPAGPPPGQGPPAGQAPGVAGASNIETTGSAEGTQYRIAYRDSNSLLSLRLQPGVEIKAKPGSMVAMDASVQIKGKVKFSFKKLIKGGELSESIFTGPGEHAFLAATGGIVREYKSQGVGKGLFSGEGLFVAEATGRGVLFVQAIGAIFQRQLRAGEEWIVDNGHLVAWTCKYKVERIQAGGVLSASHTDEGLVCRFTGPGVIYIQTRNPETLIGWIDEELPSRG